MGSTLAKLVSSFNKVRQREGTIMAIRLSISAVKQDPYVLLAGKSSTAGSVIYHTIRTDEEERWNQISSKINPDNKNSIDIGCNRGAITRRAAEKGLFSIGIDVEKENVKMARMLTEMSNCHYITQELGPGDLEKIPSFDVGFLLAVYYHWGNQFGWSKAESMLQELASSTNQLFIETENGFSKIDSKKLDTDSEPEDALLDYFETVLPNNKVNFVGETEWVSGSPRTDLIFEIK